MAVVWVRAGRVIAAARLGARQWHFGAARSGQAGQAILPGSNHEVDGDQHSAGRWGQGGERGEGERDGWARRDDARCGRGAAVGDEGRRCERRRLVTNRRWLAYWGGNGRRVGGAWWVGLCGRTSGCSGARATEVRLTSSAAARAR